MNHKHKFNKTVIQSEVNLFFISIPLSHQEDYICKCGKKLSEAIELLSK